MHAAALDEAIEAATVITEDRPQQHLTSDVYV